MIVSLCGLALVGSAGLCGFMVRMMSAALRGADLRPVVVILCALPVLRGCMYALRQSWFSRNAATVLPSPSCLLRGCCLGWDGWCRPST
ncbi:hypothetical protein [Streptomyces pseudovenezuelae]|uniref:hypothetical protein n=1 Tax=Streptomyces pseudovenezuelae TaxID=67350 RepID=UPI002E35B01A|nr:hypothetical protein [Streptomyces pseudovenezuelae]